jgi:hypothetical protein
MSYDLGCYGEWFAAQLLESLGLRVERGKGGGADLVVEGIRVEVKIARYRLYKEGRRGYQFCLRRDGRRGVCADVVLLICFSGGRAVFFVVPAEELGSYKKVTIPGPPDRYSGRWSLFVERWDILAEMTAEERGG